MASFLKNLGKTLEAAPGASETKKGEAAVLQFQVDEAADERLGQEAVEKFNAEQKQKTMGEGNILQRFGAGYKEGYKIAKQSAEQIQADMASGKLSLKEGLSQSLLVAPQQMFLGLSRGTTAATAPYVEKVLGAAYKGSIGMLPGAAQEKLVGGVGAIISKAQSAFDQLPEKDKKKWGNLGRAIESLAFIGTMFPAGQAGFTGKQAIAKGVSKIPGAAAVSKGISGAAEKQLGKVFGATKEGFKEMTQKTVQKVSSGKEKLPFALTQKGLAEGLSKKSTFYGKAIKAYEESGKMTGSTEKKSLLDWLSEQKKEHMIETDKQVLKELKGETTKKSLPEFLTKADLSEEEMGQMLKAVDGKSYVVTNPTAVKAIERLEYTVQQFGDVMPNDFLQKFKKKLYSAIETNKGWQKTVTEGTELDIKRDFAAVVRDEIAKANPNLDALNKKFSFYRNAEDILEETLKRKTSQTGFMEKLSVIPGSIVGVATGDVIDAAILGAMSYGFYKAVTSTGWRLVSSNLKKKLADALLSGKRVDIKKTMDAINKELVTAGAVSTVATQQAPEFLRKLSDIEKLKGTKFYEEQKNKGTPFYK